MYAPYRGMVHFTFCFSDQDFLHSFSLHYITSNVNSQLKLAALCRMQFLEDASARAIETVNKSRETVAVEVPAADNGDQ